MRTPPCPATNGHQQLYALRAEENSLVTYDQPKFEVAKFSELLPEGDYELSFNGRIDLVQLRGGFRLAAA